MEKKVKEKRGITLVALVITIIVMLIIAGVAISMISGNSSLFEKSTYAKEKYNNEALDESKTMDDLLALLEANGDIQHNVSTLLVATNGAVMLELSTTKEGTIEYKIEEISSQVYKVGAIGLPVYKIAENGWQVYKAAIPINENATVYTRLKDKIGNIVSEKTIKVGNIDTISPEPYEYIVTSTANSITVSGQTTDTASLGTNEDIAGIQGYQYQLDNGEWSQETASTSYTFTNLEQGSTHTVSMRAIDKAGNITEATNNSMSVTLP